jgi:hypothetical protein
MADACTCVPAVTVAVPEGSLGLRARFATVTKDNIGQAHTHTHTHTHTSTCLQLCLFVYLSAHPPVYTHTHTHTPLSCDE